MHFRTQVRLLRNEFQAIDMQVTAGERAYSVANVNEDRDLLSVQNISYHQDQPRASRQYTQGGAAGRESRQTAQGGAAGRDSQLAKPAVPKLQNTRMDKSNKAVKEGGIGKPRRVVPGHLRCAGCGSVNNHYGLGFTKDSCPFHGTKHAMPKGHIWKSSADEEAVSIPNDEYAKLLQSNPKIIANQVF